MDTIAAISTPLGQGGIGIVRISGSKSVEILDKVAKYSKEKLLPNSIIYGKIYNNNKFMDEVLISYFKAPHSYTGEDIVEINSHGGLLIVRTILNLVISNGARLAEPGEFTKRAFLNGKMDLSQAESVMDLINSKSQKENLNSASILEGTLGKKIKEIKDGLLNVLIDLEANVDYPEYDIEEITREKVLNAVNVSLNKLSNLSNSFSEGKILRDGVNTAIVGKPNVGKSSLLNRLLDEERAIVTDIAGTTRDTIEEKIIINGIAFNIIDTAGIHQTSDAVEEIGVQKSKKMLEKADLVLVLIDASNELSIDDKELLKETSDKTRIVLINKIDKDEKVNFDLDGINQEDIVYISAKENIGIDSLREKMISKFNLNDFDNQADIYITNQRHKDAIDNTMNSLINIKNSIESQMPMDMVSIDIQNALSYLGNITGDNVSEDIINGIFKRFCLGK